MEGGDCLGATLAADGSLLAARGTAVVLIRTRKMLRQNKKKNCARRVRRVVALEGDRISVSRVAVFLSRSDDCPAGLPWPNGGDYAITTLFQQCVPD